MKEVIKFVRVLNDTLEEDNDGDYFCNLTFETDGYVFWVKWLGFTLWCDEEGIEDFREHIKAEMVKILDVVKKYKIGGKK